MIVLFFLPLMLHSSPVGGGNTPKVGLSTALKPYKKKAVPVSNPLLEEE